LHRSAPPNARRGGLKSEEKTGMRSCKVFCNKNRGSRQNPKATLKGWGTLTPLEVVEEGKGERLKKSSRR
ncbi:hypothetical protein A2U01_0104870, partial [Trifolium medium]|nr:hypothetical protein [Trifolium medium]